MYTLKYLDPIHNMHAHEQLSINIYINKVLSEVKNVYQKQGFQILGGVGCYLRTNYFLFISFDCKPHVNVFCCVVTVLFLRDFFFFEMLMLSQCKFIWSAPFLVLFLLFVCFVLFQFVYFSFVLFIFSF